VKTVKIRNAIYKWYYRVKAVRLVNKETNKVTISRDILLLEETAEKSISNKSEDLEENKIYDRTKIEIDINITDTVRDNPKGLTKTYRQRN
jgi:hypothetical protein